MIACMAGFHFMEILMQPTRAAHAQQNRLRFVFNENVVSFDTTTGVTFGEVASALGRLSSRRYGNPIAIDVTVGSNARCPVNGLLRTPGV